MGFKIRHNNYRGGFLVARGSGGCNRWPWTNKSFRITTNPNRSSVITVPMEIRFRGDRRMAKRRARSGPRLFLSLSLSLLLFYFFLLLPLPFSVASTRIEDRWKRGGKGNRVMDTLDAFPVQGFAYFPCLAKHRHWRPLVNVMCARIFQIYAAEKFWREWMVIRARIFENRWRLASLAFLFFHLPGNGIRPISTNILEIYTRASCIPLYARDKERSICFNRGTRC